MSVVGKLARLFKLSAFGGGHESHGNNDADHVEPSLTCFQMNGSRVFGSNVSLVRARNFQVFQVAYSISPTNRVYQIWENWMLVMAVFSILLTPIEFGFYRGLPDTLFYIELTNNLFFVADIAFTFFVAYKDPITFNMVDNRSSIAWRYFQTTFFYDLVACIPWDFFYRVASRTRGNAEIIRAMMWFRLIRTYRVARFFDTLDRDIRFNYYGTRIFRLLCVEYFYIHIAGCVFYYLATTVDGSNQGGTWIGALTLGNFSYTNFWELDLGIRYVTSIYWAMVTMSSTGYGDIHPVNVREMVFAIIVISFNMILISYLAGNVTALVVKGTPTIKYRDKMSEIIQYMNRKSIPEGLRSEMTNHFRLRFEAEKVDDEVMENFPANIKMRVSLALYKEIFLDCYLFKNCSNEFIDIIVGGSQSKIFMPLETVVLQRGAGDALYVVCSGSFEELFLESDGKETKVGEIGRSSTIGAVSLLCSLPQPFTVRVKALAECLRISKDLLNSAMATSLADGRQLMQNLMKINSQAEQGPVLTALTKEIAEVIEQRESDLVHNAISAAARGDFEKLRKLIGMGANINSSDYDGRSALHLASCHGYVEIVRFLLDAGADVNRMDKHGMTPLREALKSGHDEVAELLKSHGGTINIKEAGSELCNAVIHGNTALLQRLINNGVDPNSADYDLRTPLHIACAEGFLLIARMLVTNGADVAARDRHGMTPLDEARRSGSQQVIDILESAIAEKSGEVIQSASTGAWKSISTELVPAAKAPKRVTIFNFLPWEQSNKLGKLIFMRSQTMEEVFQAAEAAFGKKFSIVVNGDGGEISEVNLILDGDRLFFC